MSRPAAYVIPVAMRGDTPVVLLGREASHGTWCGFGGGLEDRENAKQVATREAWEESLGYLGTKKALERTIMYWGKTQSGCDSESPHFYYGLDFTYDARLPYNYDQTYRFIRECGNQTLASHCSEKDAIAWIPFRDLRKALRMKNNRIGTHKLDPCFSKDMRTILKE